MIKGAVGSGSTERQVRLAFTLWVRDRVATGRSAAAATAGRPAPAGRARSSQRGPGWLGQPVPGRQSAEDQASSCMTRSLSIANTQRPSPRSEQLDQLGVDVELVAVLAQAAGDAEAQPLRPVGQPERRVEAGDDEAAAATGAAISQARHRGVSGGAGLAGRRHAPNLGAVPPRRHDPSVPARPVPRPGGARSASHAPIALLHAHHDLGRRTSASRARSSRARAA